MSISIWQRSIGCPTELHFPNVPIAARCMDGLQRILSFPKACRRRGQIHSLPTACRGHMTYSLADEEIRLLKELRGAGERGRPVPQAPLMLARLIKAAYVERRVEGATPRYVITDVGTKALDTAMARR